MVPRPRVLIVNQLVLDNLVEILVSDEAGADRFRMR